MEEVRYNDPDIESQEIAAVPPSHDPPQKYMFISSGSGADETRKASHSDVSSDTVDIELTKCVERSATSSDPDGTNKPRSVIQNPNLQQAKTAEIVNRKEFGNVQNAAKAPEQGYTPFILYALLCVYAAMYIVFGSIEKCNKTFLYEGAGVIVAISILLVFPYIYKKSKKRLEKQKPLQNKTINVLRGGDEQCISMSEVVIGDVVCLQRGNQVPGDGLFISGESLKLDDGLATVNEHNPFIYYGGKVINGLGRMRVTSVGLNTTWGEVMNQVSQEPNKIMLSAQLDKFCQSIQIIGVSICILILILEILRIKLGKGNPEFRLPGINGKPTSTKDTMDAIMRIAVGTSGNASILKTLTTLVRRIVEGVPFIVGLAMLLWNKKVITDKVNPQEISACVRLGSVTTICTDLWGLPRNPLKVVMCWIGDQDIMNEKTEIHANVVVILGDAISAAVLRMQNPGSSYGPALLSWATPKLGLGPEILKPSCSIDFNATEPGSWEEGGRALMKNNNQESVRQLHWSGSAKRILDMCSSYYDCEETVKQMDEDTRHGFEQMVDERDSDNLKTMAFAHKQINGPTFEDNELILIGLIGFQHVCQEQAVKDCKKVGVNIILISEDDVSELENLGLKTGLLPKSGGLVVNGEEFRNWSDEEMKNKVEQISAIGNCLPSDKLRLVQCLKQKGDIVAMTGTRTNDTPALEEANVGIAMGSWSSEFLRKRSDVIIPDGKFCSLVSGLKYGRGAYNNIKKYIQLEVTMVMAGLLVATIMTAAFGDDPIAAFQWIWVKILITFLGGLAILTAAPSEKLMAKPPGSANDPFITKCMWRNIITQTLYQATVLLSLRYTSQSILQINKKVSGTMAFNSFVLCQVFNLINTREPEKKNVFKGIHRDGMLGLVVIVILLLQWSFVEMAHIVARNGRLNGEQWAICIVIGILSLVIDLFVKSISTLFMCCLTGSAAGFKGMTHPESTRDLEVGHTNSGSTANP